MTQHDVPSGSRRGPAAWCRRSRSGVACWRPSRRRAGHLHDPMVVDLAALGRGEAAERLRVRPVTWTGCRAGWSACRTACRRELPDAAAVELAESSSVPPACSTTYLPPMRMLLPTTVSLLSPSTKRPVPENRAPTRSSPARPSPSSSDRRWRRAGRLVVLHRRQVHRTRTHLDEAVVDQLAGLTQQASALISLCRSWRERHRYRS